MSKDLYTIVHYEAFRIFRGGECRATISMVDGSIGNSAPKGGIRISGDRIRELYIDETKQPPELCVRYKKPIDPNKPDFTFGSVENVEELKKVLSLVNRLYKKDTTA